VAPQGVEIEIDADLLLLDPVEVDPSDALDAFQRSADAPVEEVPGLGEVAFGRDPPRQHLGAAAVGVAADRDVADGVREEGTGAVDGFAHLHLFDVDIDAPVEQDLYPRRPRSGVGQDAFDVRDGGDLLLYRLHHLAQGLERVGARERDLDIDLRFVDHRHEVERQQKDRHRPHHGQAEEQHQGRYGTIQRNICQSHDRS